MYAYLFGGGVGIIGVLGGAALAFYYKAKAAKAVGAAALLLLRLSTEEKEHADTLQAAVEHAEEFEDELDRKTAVLKLYKKKLSTLRSRKVETASHIDLLAIANGLRLGVSEAEEPEDDNESGDRIDTLP